MRHEEIRDAGVIAATPWREGCGWSRMCRGGRGPRVRRVGDAGHPARAVHDAITTMVYGTVRGAHRVLPRLAATIVTTAVPSARSIHDSQQGLRVVAAVNGLWGDRIAARAQTLAIPMSIRLDGRDLVPMAADVGAAVANPTPRLAVFVHGLCETTDHGSLEFRPGVSGGISHLRRTREERSRLHAAAGALQHRAARIGERPCPGAAPREDRRGVAAGGAGGGARRSLDGRAGRPQRLSLRRPRRFDLGATGPPTSSASVRRTWAHRSRRLRTWPAGRSLAGRNRFRSPRFLTARQAQGSKTCASEPSSTTTGTATILTSSSAIAVVRCRSFPTPTTTSSAPPSAEIQAGSPDGSWVISSSASRAPRAMADTAASRSRSTTATTSPA